MPAYEPVLEHHTEIAAPPAQVWVLVSDVCRMPEWSPQVDSVRLRDGFDTIELGTQFTNLNSQGELTWTTHGEIVRFTAEHEVAFRIEENHAVWSFLLEPTAGGTRLTHRRETPDGISQQSLELTEKYLGGQVAFTDTLRAGMRQTLERLKTAAEQ